jgi:hypothetical protein
MGHYEDTIYFIYEEVEKMGLRRKFDSQMKRMSGQPKHKYKTMSEKFEYAFNRIKCNKDNE